MQLYEKLGLKSDTTTIDGKEVNILELAMKKFTDAKAAIAVAENQFDFHNKLNQLGFKRSEMNIIDLVCFYWHESLPMVKRGVVVDFDRNLIMQMSHVDEVGKRSWITPEDKTKGLMTCNAFINLMVSEVEAEIKKITEKLIS